RAAAFPPRSQPPSPCCSAARPRSSPARCYSLPGANSVARQDHRRATSGVAPCSGKRISLRLVSDIRSKWRRRQMATQTAAAAGPQEPDRQVTEQEARALAGLPLLVAGIVGLLAGVAAAVVASHQSHGAGVALVVLCVLIFLASGLVLAGLTPVVPGQARVVQLFGRYRGTIRDPGLQWVHPFTRRIAVSTRIRNQESAQAKVNDAEGNPIEIAAVVVWQVADTASAIYSVDDYMQ